MGKFTHLEDIGGWINGKPVQNASGAAGLAGEPEDKDGRPAFVLPSPPLHPAPSVLEMLRSKTPPPPDRTPVVSRPSGFQMGLHEASTELGFHDMTSDAVFPQALNRVLLVESPGDKEFVHLQWSIEKRRFETKDKSLVSPEFAIEVPGHKPELFKIKMIPDLDPSTGRKGHGCFKKAKGHVRAELKCTSGEPSPKLALHLRFGMAHHLVVPADMRTLASSHDFSKQSCCSSENSWDLRRLEGEESAVLTVHIHARAAP